MAPAESAVLYLDDCSDANELIALARQAGLEVRTPRGESTEGWDDDRHLAYAASHGYMLLTYNVKDFRALHAQWQAEGRRHHGILVVYFENNRLRDMKRPNIIRAILNLFNSGLPLENEFHVLNHWR